MIRYETGAAMALTAKPKIRTPAGMDIQAERAKWNE
jgi:hypothetical protein